MGEDTDITGDDGKVYTFREMREGEQMQTECQSEVNIPDDVTMIANILEDLAQRDTPNYNMALVAIDGEALDVPIDEVSSCGVPMASNAHGQDGGRSV